MNHRASFSLCERITCTIDRDRSNAAFDHALALASAIGNGVQLQLLHAEPEAPDPSDCSGDFPGIRERLITWQKLPPGSPRADVLDVCGIRASKVLLTDDDPLDSLTGYLTEHRTDLLVMNTEGRSGLPRWIEPSFAERLARDVHVMTLFIAEGVFGFIDPASGDINLRRILLPVDHEPDPQRAAAKSLAIARLLAPQAIEILVTHVGEPDDSDVPYIESTGAENVSWRQEIRHGSPVPEILQSAKEFNADLIVMTTAGHYGVLDALRGSTTEQVLREAPCPVLAVPAPLTVV